MKTERVNGRTDEGLINEFALLYLFTDSPPTVKRNSRTENIQWTFEGISTAREFRRNIECLKAEKTDSQPRD